MNSNNWLSRPLSPTHSYIQPLNSHSQFTLGLIRENMESPFASQVWNMMNCQSSNEPPKVADFLGMSKTESRSAMSAFNEIQSNNVENYFFSNTTAVPAQMMTESSSDYKFQESAVNLQSLKLSMGSGSENGSATDTSDAIVESAVPRRNLETFGQRTSIYRGVTRHRWTGRYEAHLWDNSCRREGQSRKGRQVYLGGYDKEEKAARAYDMAALKYWGASATINFQVSDYEKELEEMKHMSRQEFVASIRRKSSGFSRGASMYRGVTRHHQHGRWQARIGRVAGNKDLYLGTFSTEEEAAEAYDVAAIKFRGLNAVTNFDMNRYDVKSILDSNTLPIGGGAAKRLKEAQAMECSRKREELMAFGTLLQYGNASNARLHGYSMMPSAYDQQQPPQLLGLQNHDLSPYGQDVPFQPNYHQTQLHLHQSPNASYMHGQTQLYGASYNAAQSNPMMFQGLYNTGGSSSSGGFYGSGLTIGPSPASGSLAEPEHRHDPETVVKVDYDMQSAAYGGWSGDSINGLNSGFYYNMG